MLEWIVRSAPRTKNKFSLGRNSSSFNSLIFQPRNVNLRNVKNEKLKQIWANNFLLFFGRRSLTHLSTTSTNDHVRKVICGQCDHMLELQRSPNTSKVAQIVATAVLHQLICYKTVQKSLFFFVGPRLSELGIDRMAFGQPSLKAIQFGLA